MDTMKAVVYDRPGKFAVRQIPLSEPGAGEVLLRVLVAGVCGTICICTTASSGQPTR
jgi:D-arabinitol dehydrogenase (NADP+)